MERILKLQETANELFTKKTVIKDSYQNKINTLIKQYLPECWFVRYLSDGVLCISFQEGFWRDNERKLTDKPMYHDLEIYHGYDFNYDIKTKKTTTVFRYEMNICARGSFTIGDISEKYSNSYVSNIYYGGVGIILNTPALNTTLYNILKEYADAVKEIKNEISNIDTQIMKIKSQIEIEKRTAEAIKRYNNIKIDIENNATGYVVFKKLSNYNDEPKFYTYRRNPIEVMFAGPDEYAAKMYIASLPNKYDASNLIIRKVSQIKAA